jgi:hypothetical protein
MSSFAALLVEVPPPLSNTATLLAHPRETGDEDLSGETRREY